MRRDDWGLKFSLCYYLNIMFTLVSFYNRAYVTFKPCCNISILFFSCNFCIHANLILCYMEAEIRLHICPYLCKSSFFFCMWRSIFWCIFWYFSLSFVIWWLYEGWRMLNYRKNDNKFRRIRIIFNSLRSFYTLRLWSFRICLWIRLKSWKTLKYGIALYIYE